MNKHNGETVAVKTFNQLSHMRPQEVQMREFEVLQKVKHENIVKLLAIEEEQEGRGKVIVMELCTGELYFDFQICRKICGLGCVTRARVRA